jgi:16S rRNA (cytidine1402-2'-O)-methyltransferase
LTFSHILLIILSFYEDKKLNNDIKAGMLYLVSTPIGNMEDITFRALRILKEVDIIAAEDTRRTGLLLKHFHIKSSLESYHDYNKEKKTPHLLDLLSKGRSVAVVSDAGTPGISDPAYYLVKRAIEASVPISPIPGATAAMASIITSGLPTNRFVFEGFLPQKKRRKKRLEQLKYETRTIILYESPHRLVRTLNDLLISLGDRQVAVCRELTKKFEEIIRGSLSEMVEIFNHRRVKGEIVLVIEGY